MGRSIGPKHKLCRRVGSCIWHSAKCPSSKRPFAPGQHGQTARRKLSVYGQQLQEKQKIRIHYAIMEKQMRKTFKEAQRMGGVTGTNLLALLEARLDCVVYRLGFAPTIHSARQLVNHGHITVDGKRVDIPSFHVKPGMIIGIRERSKKVPMISDGVEHPPSMLPGFLERAPKSYEGRMIATPNSETIPFQVDMLAVIGFYSR
ncbi:MAG: 30S ribosomal protein S4 [Candidatus Hydrogenedentes bacterium]|nr:30S ribosomal protein S4 [Candidatus Hydrogenedentota bacterium]